jgi:Ferritin-like
MSADGIDDLGALRAHLQTAIEIEWSTIPPYLCALWSLGDVHNRQAAACLRDVVMEEMLHLTLAANVLNALGGEPRLGAGSVPRYPAALPHSDRSFTVSLLPFCPEALETFRRIEHPALIGAPPQADGYATIAQFYEAVGEAVERIGADPAVWTGHADRQVGPAGQYYGGGGDAIVVAGRDDALEALQLIVDEGEGFDGSIFDGDHQLLGEAEELAHYFRFDELARGRRYRKGDTPSQGPTGEPLLLDYGAVAPMRPNPRPQDHPEGSELRALTDECDATYARLIARLQTAFTGTPAALAEAVHDMWALEYQAIALMHVPVGDGLTAGPAFSPPD